ncbi:g8697 [Coccomyxa elongata]
MHSTSISDVGLPRAAVLGVLGGGQLGKMLAADAARMGIKIEVLDPTPNCPAAVVAKQTLGSFRDPVKIRKFAEGVDVLTVEIEHIDADALDTVAADLGLDVEPTPSTLRLIQDKLVQKRHFQAAGVPVADFMGVDDPAAAAAAAQAFGFPFMLKARRLAYDGRGNAVVRSREELEGAVEQLGSYGQGLYAERWASFVKELAVMVGRSRDGSTMAFPVVETLHQNSILLVTEAPAQVPPETQRRAQEVAEQAVACLDGAGVFGVEMFLLADGALLLNEMAPRPHNSGHYTIEACATSQYEQHLRAVMGWPLGATDLAVPACIMLNILGEADGEEGVQRAHEVMARAYQVPGASVHWYGKAEVAPQRKVGHVTIVAPSAAEARSRLAAIDPSAAAALASTSGREEEEGGERPRVGIIMGSDSDLPTMRAAAEVLRDFGIAAEVTVVSAHRTPDRMLDYARSAHSRGINVIIAGAGGAAHLPGMVAALTPLPVIGVPVRPAGAHLDGLDALLSIVQMPRGVPVATVAIGNAANAGLLAARMLAAYDPALLQKMLEYQEGMRTTVLAKAERLESIGWEDY